MVVKWFFTKISIISDKQKMPPRPRALKRLFWQHKIYFAMLFYLLKMGWFVVVIRC